MKLKELKSIIIGKYQVIHNCGKINHDWSWDDEIITIEAKYTHIDTLEPYAIVIKVICDCIIPAGFCVECDKIIFDKNNLQMCEFCKNEYDLDCISFSWKDGIGITCAYCFAALDENEIEEKQNNVL